MWGRNRPVSTREVDKGGPASIPGASSASLRENVLCIGVGCRHMFPHVCVCVKAEHSLVAGGGVGLCL